MTEPFSKTSRMVRASSGAIGSTVSVSKCFSGGIGSVLVAMTSRAPQFARRSVAGSEKTPCVVAMITSFAPASLSTPTAPAMVPPVSIMSSISTQVRPATSPTTRLLLTWFATLGSRVLCTKARGAPSRASAHFSPTLTRPASGETTTMFSVP